MPKLKKQSESQRFRKQVEIITKRRDKKKMKKNEDLANAIPSDECQEITSNILNNARSYDTYISEVIVGDFCQFSNEFPLPHHQCTAMAAVALATASFKSVISWNSNDLNNIIRAGQKYYEKCKLHQSIINSKYDETFLEAINLLENLTINNKKMNVFVNLTECRGGPHVEGIFVEAIKNFEKCQFTYGIITFRQYSYGLLRLHNTNGPSSYAFFDSHGRNDDGSRPGSKSAILLFENDSMFINFFLKENHLLSPLHSEIHDEKNNLMIIPLHFIANCEDRLIDSATNKDSPLFTKVISGSFAQNDIRFDNRSRNKQCTANSVVFLAFASILGKNISSTDLDSILMLGDQIYNASHSEAIKIRSNSLQKSERLNPYLAAHEIQKDFFVNIDRLNFNRFKVVTQPMPENEYSGNFSKYAKTYIERFFQKYTYGVFICSSLSIALCKVDDHYVIFDPHSRTAKGCYKRNGKSNTFFFSSIELLHQYLHNSGYELSNEFTLTPFTIKHGKDLNYNCSNTIHFSNQMYESNDCFRKRKCHDNENDSRSIKRSNIDDVSETNEKEYKKLRMQKYRSELPEERKIETNIKVALQKKNKRLIDKENESKETTVKIPYTWPAPIDETIKKKCLIDFVKKMAKEEILQRTCCICNIVGFRKDFKEVKFSDLQHTHLLQPNKELLHIVPGVEDFFKKVETNHETNIQDDNKEIKKKSIQNLPEVIICQVEGSNNANTSNNKNILNCTNSGVANIKKIKNDSYFCYKNSVLYKAGIDLENELMSDDKICNICSNCYSSLHRKIPVTPYFSPANDSFIGDVPEELQNLTIPEQQLISLYRHNKCIIKIQAKTYDASTRQSKISGNVIVFEQNMGSIAKTLPFSQDSLCETIKVVFVGSSPPTKVETSKLLKVRREKVKKALQWLIANNHLYKDINISENNINDLPQDEIPNTLWMTMDSTSNIEASNSCRSGYTNENVDNIDNQTLNNSVVPDLNQICDSEETLVALSTSAMVDIDGVDTSTDDIQNHIINNTFIEKETTNDSDKTYYMIPRSEKPVNQYDNPLLLLGLFPTLFPYGLGSPDNPNRKVKTCYKSHLQYLLNYHDKRFEEHYSFQFVVFNIWQRRNACYNAKLMMNQPYSRSYALQINKVKSGDVQEALKIISQRKKDTNFLINSDVNRLVKQVKAVGGNIQGSIQARSKLRVNLHSLIYNRGLPHLFLTINPADTCNPVGLLICGVDIDFENVFNKFPSGYVRSQIVASHPVSTSKFFNYLIENIISTLIMGGVLGPMDSYFGPVESQGRGSLHVHMLLWLSHRLKPKDIMEKISDPEFRENLIKYLEDVVKETIAEHGNDFNPTNSEKMSNMSNNKIDLNKETKTNLKYIKGDIPAACLFTPDPRDADYKEKFDQDIVNLVNETNIHRHNATCYKYAKLADKKVTCRMRFPRAKVEESSIDPETGELKLRRTHEWLNNYNETIISACRCNMDIKYIFSGKDAKALTYYITDYVTKSSLSFYDIFSLIHDAVKILEEQSPNNADQNVDIIERSRKLILKCYNTIASKTELSGVQVASYLMNYKDHYTNQSFENIFLIGIERYVQTGLDIAKKISNNDQSEQNIESVIEHEENDNLLDEDINEDKNDEQFNLELNADGSSFVMVNQRVDYEHRPIELDDICLYEFVSKYKKKKKDKSDENFIKDQENNEILKEIDLEINDLPKKTRGRRPQKRYIFTEAHPQTSTHILVRRVKEVIPVLVGPQIPRKNREITQERYCRSILTLFLPWRKCTDLCSPDESWLESWKKNEKYLSHVDVIDNIELLHECKEQKNEHLIQIIEQLDDENIEPPFYARLRNESDSESEVDEELSNLLNMCDDSNNNINKKDSDYINSTIEALSKVNRFTINQNKNKYLISKSEQVIKHTNDEDCSGRKKFNVNLLVPATKNLHEKNIKWQLLLKNEKEKIRSEILYGTSNELSDLNKSTHLYQQFVNLDNTDDKLPEVVVRSIDITTQEFLINEYKLNEEQRRAFIVITDHLDQKSFLNTDGNTQEQLIMCIPAPAGTGKSHLNRALTEYFNLTDRLSMLRKLAPTSVAANEMGQGGLTMQSFLHCNLPTKMSQTRKSNVEKEWKHIKYIFVDEVSMLGLDNLAKLSRLMSLAKEDWADASHPFGGKNIIFFGDLMQYKPVMDIPVYTDILNQGYDSKNAKEIFKEIIEKENTLIQLEEQNSEQRKQENAQARKEKRQAIKIPKINNSIIRKKVGRALWLQINAVVILKQQMRTTDKRLLDIQSRIREGKATKDDHNELRKRIAGVGNEVESLNESPWNSAPIIIFRNDLRTCINTKAVERLANENNIPMIVCVANDRFSIISKKNKEIARYILSLDDNKTQNLPGYLPLVTNMPVMITRSLFTELEVSNGTIGIFKQLIYDDVESDTNEMVDTNKFPKNTIYIHKPVFALIELVKTEKLPNFDDLPSKILPVPLDEQEFSIDLSKMLPSVLRKRCIRAPLLKVKRKQFPLVPAYAFTTHKSQGQTIPKVVLDMNFPPPPFNKEVATAYVPLTRVKVMEDLAFCRDFPLSNLQIQPSEEQKKEIQRLEKLNNQTKTKFENHYIHLK